MKRIKYDSLSYKNFKMSRLYNCRDKKGKPHPNFSNLWQVPSAERSPWLDFPRGMDYLNAYGVENAFIISSKPRVIFLPPPLEAVGLCKYYLTFPLDQEIECGGDPIFSEELTERLLTSRHMLPAISCVTENQPGEI